MNRIAELFLDMLYPRRCPLCHEVLGRRERMVCNKCIQDVKPLSGARCMKCGKPTDEEEEYCRECKKGKHVFTEGRGIFLYNEKWKRSLVRFKYYGCREYGDFYARAMCVFGRRELERWKPELIIPVPMHRAKKRLRGFNQAEYLAKGLSRDTGIPWDDSAVIKIKKTRSQKKLNADERRRNLKKAFRVTKNLKKSRILVVDDVYTTGSTIDAVAMCLREAGAEEIYFLTVCIGRN